MRRPYSLLLSVLIVATLGALAACSGPDSPDRSPEDRLAAAKQDLDDARFVGFTLTGEDLPDTTVLESAHGTGTHAPSFTGEVQVKRGLSFTAPVVAIDGLVYLKLPFAGWSTIQPADYGAPDPAALMDTDTGISSLITSAADLTVGGTARDGSEVLTEISGTLPGKSVHALFPSASADQPFDVTFTLTEDDRLHGVTITGKFYGPEHGDSRYVIELDTSAAPVRITAPE